MSERLDTDSVLCVQGYVTFDSRVETRAALSTEEIVASVLPQEEEEEEVTLVEEAPRIPAKEALMYLEKVKFWLPSSDGPEKVYESWDTVALFMTTAALSAPLQQRITTCL